VTNIHSNEMLEIHLGFAALCSHDIGYLLPVLFSRSDSTLTGGLLLGRSCGQGRRAEPSVSAYKSQFRQTRSVKLQHTHL
jgi:hypothetical protein